MSVVSRFLKTALDEYTRGLLLGAIGECQANGDSAIRSFEFNVHIVTIDGQNATVKIEDILDPSDDGAETWPLHEFADAVRCR